MGQVVRTDKDSLREHAQSSKLTCRRCKNTIVNDSVGIIPGPEHKNKKDVWHTRCFRCEECDDLLADLLYFFKNGEYLCGRHFCERNFERCSGCDEV
jgi:hypothetical protein